jgi:hypothetical protein
VVAWTAALVGLGAWGVLRGGATDRGQTTVAQAAPVVDRASVDLASAATVDGLAVVSISDFVNVGSCRVTVFRLGARYQRVVTALVRLGGEDALLRRVAGRLPRGYDATVTTRAPVTMTADAGLFVTVSGSVASPGVVRFVVDTGDCRSTGDIPVATTSPTGTQAAAVRVVLDRLGATARSVRRYAVTCPDGGQLATVEALALTAVDGSYDVKLGSVTGAKPIATAADLYAYTVDQTQVAVRSVQGGVDVTSTVLCVPQ